MNVTGLLKRWYVGCTIMIFSLISKDSHAQTPTSLSNCIEYGLRNHNSKFVYANETLIAEAKNKEIKAGYLPAVAVSAAIDNNLKVQESIIPAGVFGPNETRAAFTKKFAANGSVQLDQTIFDQSLLVGLKANKLNRQQAILSETLNDETIVYNIASAYYQVFIYKKQIDLLIENLKSYEEQIRISKLGLEKGVVIEADVRKLEVNYNNTASQIITAETNLELSENQLKNAMGFPQEDMLLLSEINTENPQKLFDQFIYTDSLSVENRLEYKLSQNDIALLEIDEKKIRAGAYPKITAYARYGLNGFGNKLGESMNTLNDFSAIGIKLSIPLFDGFKRKSQYTQTILNREISIKNLDLDKQKFTMEYRNNLTKLHKAQKSMEIDSSNILLAQSVFKSVNLQYQKGVIDLTDWLNAQYSLKEAQTNYLNSLYNFCIAGVDLEKSKGTLLQFYKSF